MEDKKKHIITLWDGDIYVLEGYKSAAEIRERMAGLEWITMPNGSEIKPSSISKIQEVNDYRFQIDQKQRHRRGQFLTGRGLERWDDIGGEVTGSNIKAISGEIKNMPAIHSPELAALE